MGGMQHAAGSEQFAAGGFDSAAGGLDECGYLLRQALIERIALRARVHDGPALAGVLGNQTAIATGAKAARLRQPLQGQAGDAEPVLFERQRAGGEGVVEALDALLDEPRGLFDELLALGIAKQSEGLLAQLARDCRQIGLYPFAHLGEQAAATQFGCQAFSQAPGFTLVVMPDQQHQVALERLLHALGRQPFERVVTRVGQELQQVGTQRRAVAPLTGIQRQQAEQRQAEQRGRPAPGLQALSRQDRVARWP